ncbi:MAG TPA: AI-2E family transporter [Candidatus Paceibacterota bacterium]|jgi:predicted PurR-regulated permease PerM|nr:AI-2E family transporter [Candidatus Paceibacterota bacterium]
MDKEVTISITAGTVLKTLIILALAWFIYTIRGIVLIVLTAIVIASAVEPGVAALVKRKIPRIISVIIVYLCLFALGFIVFYFFVPTVLTDLATFIGSLPIYLSAFTHAGGLDQYAQILGLPEPSTFTASDLWNSVASALNLNSVFGNALTAATTIFGGVFSFFLIIIFSFYFAVMETGVDDFLRIVVPRKHLKYALGLWRRSQHKIGLWMQGQLLLGFIMGILIYLMLTVFGVPNALILAVIAAIFEIIPVFGPILAAVPAIMIAFVAGGVTLGVITVFIYVIAQQFESQLIYPLVVSRVVGVPPLLVILALIIGGELGGFLGIILSVPVAATIQELVRDIESGRLYEHEKEAAKT